MKENKFMKQITSMKNIHALLSTSALYKTLYTPFTFIPIRMNIGYNSNVVIIAALFIMQMYMVDKIIIKIELK